MTPDPKPTEALKPWSPLFQWDHDWSQASLYSDDTLEIRDGAGILVHFTVEETASFLKWIDDRPRDDRDAELAAMRSFIGSIAKGWDCDTGAGGSHASYCRCCEAEKLLASTAGTELLERLRVAEEVVAECMRAMPCGNIQTHAPENLAGRITEMASALAQESAEHERELAAVTAERDEACKLLIIEKNRTATAESESAGLRKALQKLISAASFALGWSDDEESRRTISQSLTEAIQEAASALGDGEKSL